MIDLSSLNDEQLSIIEASSKLRSQFGAANEAINANPNLKIMDDYSSSYGMNAMIKYGTDGTPKDVTDKARQANSMAAIESEIAHATEVISKIRHDASSLKQSVSIKSGDASVDELFLCGVAIEFVGGNTLQLRSVTPSDVISNYFSADVNGKTFKMVTGQSQLKGSITNIICISGADQQSNLPTICIVLQDSDGWKCAWVHRDGHSTGSFVDRDSVLSAAAFVNAVYGVALIDGNTAFRFESGSFVPTFSLTVTDDSHTTALIPTEVTDAWVSYKNALQNLV